MRKFFLAILSLALVSTSPFNCFADEDTDVPVNLVVGIVEGANINGISFYVPSTSADGIVLDSVSVGGYKCVVKTFNDVFDDIDKIQKINNTIYKNLQSAVLIGSSKQAFAKRADLSIAYLEVFEFNQQSINQAFALKAKKLYDNGNGSSTQEQIESNTKSISELKSASEGMTKNFNEVYKTVIELNKTLKSNSSELRSEITSCVSDVEELKKRVSENMTPQEKEEIFRAIAEARSVQENLTKLNGLVMYATEKCNEVASSSISVVGGGALAIPTQIGTYSNQVAQLSKFLGAKEEEMGLDNAGKIVLPTQMIEPSDITTAGESGLGKASKNIIAYLWQFGFMPFLPKEANATIVDPDVESYLGGRFFYFVEDGDNLVLHANNIQAPVEWNVERPWTFDATTGKWKNSFIQIGNTTVQGQDLTAIDGENYAKVSLSSKSISIVDSIPSQSSGDGGIQDVYFFVGTIESDGDVRKQTNGSFYIPIVFLYE